MSYLLPWLLLIAIGILGWVGKNMAVVYAVIVLLCLKIPPLDRLFPFVSKQGLTLGIVILTVAVISPLASGEIPFRNVVHSFSNWQGIAAIIVGIAMSWIGGKGVSYLSVQPGVVTGLLVGTIIGVAFFRGVPVGPLIAAGLVSLLVSFR